MKFNEATPFGAWGGMPGGGAPGFSDYLAKNGYNNEQDIISILPDLDPVQQVMLDIKLNMNGVDNFPGNGNLLYSNSNDKKKLIPIFRGKVRNLAIIHAAINTVLQSKKSHEKRAANQLTGSHAWNDTWIRVYNQWLKKLHNILGELNGTQN